MSVVLRLRIVSRTWLSSRTRYFIPGHRQSCALDPVFDNDGGARSIYSIDIFLDRWLLCIYQEKLVEIWDLDSVFRDPHKPILCTSQNIGGIGSFSSAITRLDEGTNVLTVAVSCHELCHVLQVQLRPSSAFYLIDEDEDLADVRFRTVAATPIASPVLSLRAIIPEQSLLLLSLPSTFHLLNWETKERTVVHVLSEEEEELWNGVVAATFLTSRHLLVLKAHSIEVFTLLDVDKGDPGHSQEAPVQNSPRNNSKRLPCPSERHMCAVVHSHYLPSTTFRGASFAYPVLYRPAHSLDTSSSQPDATRVSTSFLAFDVLRGLFHFSVSMMLPSTAEIHPRHEGFAPIDVHIELLASHNMALPIVLPPPVDGITMPTEGTRSLPRSGFSQGMRGFVSSCALGPSGKRGVWVERRRGAVRRVVYAFDANRQASPDDNLEKGSSQNLQDQTNDTGGTPEEPSTSNERVGGIKGHEVYEVNSYDLRDDITHIAFAEATGLIALGTRKGDIRVLGRMEAD
ncbi:hypothetical protein BN946_scf184851.g50 [Trametes cinnabarina]|uniref:Cleavage/polyadenylation specificity factor A subunit N-terminal domain-containing protein n=1 Tax=Pycnoporus cinnabarinus TaxID=5643 RepID=A0A060S5E0_PYCCI|nr:hypothetical protein BN946_scf184851.g50 [Trametes cinnabarina]